ncbi:MAG: nitroreductase family protein [Chloroflexi bacterium]|nr:MAG: nitroreductase family protein [Chloroflexota bacterium]
MMQNENLHTSPVLEAIFNRRSIRRYRGEHVPREMIEEILQAAIRAPSAHNRQPWRFVVIESQHEKEQLAQAMGTRLRHDLEADNVPQDVIDKDVSRSYSRITAAPVLIILCLSMIDMDVYPDERRNRNEYLMAVQSTAMAGQNLLLAAHATGLASCWMCAPLFVPDLVRERLALPEDWQPQALITLGYPAENRSKPRHNLERSVIWR